MHHSFYGLHGPGDAVFVFFEWVLRWQMLLALLAGLTLPFVLLRADKSQPRLTIVLRLVSLLSLFCLATGTLGQLTLYGLSNLYFLHPSSPVEVSLSTQSRLWPVLFTVAGIVFHLILRRQLVPELDKLKQRLVKKTSLERNQRTDVRHIKEVLPTTEKYNPLDFIDLEKGIFIGLDVNREPQYIPVDSWQKQHADIIGTTGAGKGVASGLLLYQSILAGEGVFVMDPKDDEWAPHLFKTACEAAGKPFYLLDLRKSEYQLDFLKDITPEHLEELFIAGFSLAEKGEAADFYRIDDRRAARAAASQVQPGMTLRELFRTDYVQGISEEIKGFFGKIEELSLLNSINAKDGMALQSVFDDGGCCYVIGSMRNSKIIAAQRMILVRLLQLAELRDRINGTPRPIAIFLDELKYHLSRPALEGLGAARDKGVHIIMAHQSIADLRDCPADLNGDSVVGAVVENAKFKLVYKLQDPDTADWVSRMTGTILVDDETRSTSTNEVLTEVIDDRRSIRQAERHFIDSNMLLNLPPFVSFVFTTSELPRASMIAPVIVSKKPLEIFSVPQEETTYKGKLDWDDEPDDTGNVG
ncbi:type IV secretory system conjugative DNA transfer family protein [Citrobacter koseri]|uniref:type IV secretory system conjugative DNA transfer family protein n=1 Tax=Citrobacter koseri TaxID=545 RepID=UPI001F160E40|nr:type IV secretory system conjugative DNA transfer family protein [Citrobacter koseri]